MRQYPQHCDCMVCGEPNAHLGYYSREDGRPVYVCEHCGAFFKLAKAGAAKCGTRLPKSRKKSMRK